MSEVTLQDISRLREVTGVGIVAAKKALEAAGGSFETAVETLRKAGQKVAASKTDRATKEGLIGHYVHANGKVAAMVTVTCETDFVARSDVFQSLIHDLALHVAAANPLYVRPEEVPAEVLTKEREIYREQVAATKKPANIVEQIVNGKLDKFFEETCLLNQKFVKDDSQTVLDLVNGAIQKLGENIQVREFVRLSV
ncbi:MAG: elongation factor Ts [Candidatus Kerfeldbacteria bacterium]|nr:elongation factor Ts [Candidatus Kerfeldbacteria bacterium]